MAYNGRIMVTLLTILLACSTPEPEEAAAPAPTPRPSGPPAPHLDLRVFYVMGDKQQSSAPKADQERWAEELREALRSGGWDGTPRDLLTTSGGGPNGAEWNPDADLYVVGHTELVADPVEATLTLNGERLAIEPTIETSKGHTVVAWRLAQPAWSAALRPLSEPADYALLFSEAELTPYQPNLADSPLNWGEILRLELAVRSGQPSTERRREQAFHIAFGE